MAQTKEAKHAYYVRTNGAAKEAERRRIRGPEENRRRALKDRSTPRGFLTGIVVVAKQRAARRGFECTITRDYLFELYQEQEGLCAITGDPMTTIAGQGRQRMNISVDRIDSTGGYAPGNVQLVCDYVNTAKGNMTAAEFADMCRKVLR